MRSVIMGQLRSLSDQFGPPGICAKRGQNNSVVQRSGALRLCWRNRVLARRFRHLVLQLFGRKVRVTMIRRQ